MWRNGDNKPTAPIGQNCPPPALTATHTIDPQRAAFQGPLAFIDAAIIRPLPSMRRLRP
jgi:hypothetical protein